MLNSKAFWITTNGEILDIGLGTHIGFVIQNPEIFNLTKGEIVSAYHGHGELLGVEGRARYEIIMKLLANGFIRIRLYPNKYWSISANIWDSRTKKILSHWAKIAKEIKNSGRYMDIVISTHEQVIKDYTVEALFLNKHQ